jgi:hypothetical protein
VSSRASIDSHYVLPAERDLEGSDGTDWVCYSGQGPRRTGRFVQRDVFQNVYSEVMMTKDFALQITAPRTHWICHSLVKLSHESNPLSTAVLPPTNSGCTFHSRETRISELSYSRWYLGRDVTQCSPLKIQWHITASIFRVEEWINQRSRCLLLTGCLDYSPDTEDGGSIFHWKSVSVYELHDITSQQA